MKTLYFIIVLMSLFLSCQKSEDISVTDIYVGKVHYTHDFIDPIKGITKIDSFYIGTVYQHECHSSAIKLH